MNESLVEKQITQWRRKKDMSIANSKAVQMDTFSGGQKDSANMVQYKKVKGAR